MADQQLVTTASAVVKEMTDNANFPNPPVDLKVLATAVDDLSAAVAAQVQGGTAYGSQAKQAGYRHRPVSQAGALRPRQLR